MTSRELPTQRTRVRGWDLASSKGKGAAYTAGVLISKTRKGEFIVEDVQRDRLAPHEVEEFIVKTAQLRRLSDHSGPAPGPRVSG